MQFSKLLFFLVLAVSTNRAQAQSTYLPRGSKDYRLLERLEIKCAVNSTLNFSATKPYNRKLFTQQVLQIDSAMLRKDSAAITLSSVDAYNVNSLLMNNSEWVPDRPTTFLSKKPWFNTFYSTKPNFLEVKKKDFFLVVNPLLQFHLMKESGNQNALFLNSRGVSARGMIAEKVGFYTMITDNQERGPTYFADQVDTYRAVPGVGFYKRFKGTGYDYFDARGYFTFTAAKYINFQAGFDKNFIGNGFRSLFLSDWGNSYLFMKINTKIWKLNYQNLFMELMPQFTKNGDSLLDRKYAAIHHLSMNVTKWLNIGLFEGVVFGRRNRFDFQYFNPIIFYRHIEGGVGSPDNALAGMDFKANIKKRFQVYGQLLLDEFILKEVRNNPTSWTNKFGFQLGGKYIDAFGINNLDLQLEWNRVRPFTYSHKDTVANYTHYNQPLAHPLGANFQEFIGIANYQPIPKLNINARAIYFYRGLDSAGINFGGNIFETYLTRVSDNGFKVGSGDKLTCFNASIDVNYELRENLFLEAGMQYRLAKLPRTASFNSTLFSAGLRLNLAKRMYDF